MRGDGNRVQNPEFPALLQTVPSILATPPSYAILCLTQAVRYLNELMVTSFALTVPIKALTSSACWLT